MRCLVRFFAVALLCAGLLAGCAPQASKVRVFWPPLPDQPRLEWLAVYYTAEDMTTSSTSSVMRKALGNAGLEYFSRPSGIVADGQGRVYVADVDAKTVRVFDFNRKVAEPFSSKAVFQSPAGLELDQSGNLYVADPGAGKVLVFSSQGQPLFACSSEDMTKPAYLALNEKLGRLYVSDGREDRIVVFDLKGRHLFSFGRRGGEEGTFNAPQGLAIDGQGRLFVADQLNARIQVFDAEGQFLYKFGGRGDQQWEFEGPKDLAFDGDGNLHVLDVRKAALVIYSPEGRLLLHLGGKATSSPVGFSLPVALSITKDNKIYIAEGFNRRFSVWQYLSEEFIRQNPLDEKTVEEQLKLLKKK